MNAKYGLYALFVLTVLSLQPLYGASTTRSLESKKTAVIMMGEDPIVSGKALKIIERAHQKFSRLMGLSEPKDIRFLYTMRDPDDEDVMLDSFPRSLEKDETGFYFQIFLYGNPERVEESIQRTAIISLLQAHAVAQYFAKGGSEITMLKHPPLWLSEGAVQSMTDTRYTWEKIVHRYASTKFRPSLKEVQLWDELGIYDLERSYRKAFCFWAFYHAVENPPQKKKLVNWLSELVGDGGVYSYWPANKRTEKWWEEQLEQRLRERIPVMGFQESLNELDRLKVVELTLADPNKEKNARTPLPAKAKPAAAPAKPTPLIGPLPEEEIREGEPETLGMPEIPEASDNSAWYSITDLPMDQRRFVSNKPVTALIGKLIDLELRAHWIVRGTIEAYRLGVEGWLKGNAETFQHYTSEAAKLDYSVRQYMAKVRDKTDYMVVNTPIDVETRGVRNYSVVARELEEERLLFRQEQLLKLRESQLR